MVGRMSSLLDQMQLSAKETQETPGQSSLKNDDLSNMDTGLKMRTRWKAAMFAGTRAPQQNSSSDVPPPPIPEVRRSPRKNRHPRDSIEVPGEQRDSNQALAFGMKALWQNRPNIDVCQDHQSCCRESESEESSSETEAESDEPTDNELSDDNDIFNARSADITQCPKGYGDSILERKRLAVQDASLLVRGDANLPLCPEGGQMEVPFTQLDMAYKLPIWHCVFKDCTACADNVSTDKSSEGELWNHINTTHAPTLVEIMSKHQLIDHIDQECNQTEWMFALLIEALAFHTSLVG